MGCASSTVAEAKPAHPDFFNSYVLGVRIGMGTYAQVRVAKKNDNTKELPRTRAVKILDLEPGKNGERYEQLYHKAQNEVDVWNSVGYHDHCVRLHHTFFDYHACYMVMEKCESSLLGHLERMPVVNERIVGGMLLQMLRGIEHVHAAKVVHRDVKPGNFLVGGDNGGVVKLCDFGLARVLRGSDKLVGMSGTTPFMAPEMLQEHPYAHEIDLWSFGVTSYILFFGSFPYEPKVRTAYAMRDAILNGVGPKFKVSHRSDVLMEQTCSHSATAFVKSVLLCDANARPTASEALRGPFMAAVAQDNHMLGVGFPCLRATIKLAKTMCELDRRHLQRYVTLDSYLNARQLTKHDASLPELGLVVLDEGMTSDPVPTDLVNSKHRKKSGVVAGFPSNRGRFQSNPLEETCASTSCGTSKIDSAPTSKERVVHRYTLAI